MNTGNSSEKQDGPSFWIRVELVVAYVCAATVFGLGVFLICRSAAYGWSWWLLAVPALMWCSFQTFEALMMTRPLSRRELDRGSVDV